MDVERRRPALRRRAQAEVAQDSALSRVSSSGGVNGDRDERFFRNLNERIARAAAELGFRDFFPLVCECRDPRCFRLIRARPGEYDELVEHEGRFAIFPGHEDVESERLVDATDRFVLVERL
jgi:hypothetical protein